MKRGLALFFAALLTALALTACGGSAGGVVNTSAASGGDSAPADYFESGGSSSTQKNWGFYSETDDEAPAASPETEEGQSELNSRLVNAKMVYTAYIEAETMDFDACASDMEALVEEMGGYMEYASASSYSDGYRAGTYTVRVPSARFNAFLKSIGEIGHITDQNKSAENISEQYYDTESRLATQKTKLERLQMLLAQAENMEDIITLESAIAETELQIEQLTGSLRRYDALVDFATIDIRLREVPRLSTVEEAPPTFLSQLGNAFADGLHGFGDFLQGLAIFLAYNWTWMLLLIVIVLLIVRISKRRQAQRTETFGQASQKARKESFEHFRFHRGEEPKKPDDKQPKD